MKKVMTDNNTIGIYICCDQLGVLVRMQTICIPYKLSFRLGESK